MIHATCESVQILWEQTVLIINGKLGYPLRQRSKTLNPKTFGIKPESVGNW